MSPNTNRSPTAVPASPTRSSGSPVISPRPKLAARARRGRGHGRVRGLHPGDQRRIDRHVAVARQIEKALGEIDVVGGERGLDLARRNGGIERALELVVGEQRRIVLGIEQRFRLDPARHDRKGGDRAGTGKAQRQCDPRSGSCLVHAPAAARPLKLVPRQLRQQDARIGCKAVIPSTSARRSGANSGCGP